MIRAALGRAIERPDADARAGRRFALAAVGLLVVAVVVGVLGALVEGRWDPLIDLDLTVSQRAEDWFGWLVWPARVLTHLGDPLWLTVVTALLVGWLHVTHHRRLALFLFVSRIGAVLLSTTVKEVVDRARPVFHHPVEVAHGSSFPSGHTLGATAFWCSTAIVLLSFDRHRRWPLVLAVVLPLVTAATRVLLGVHYLSDVTAGLLLGLGWTWACTMLFVVWSEEEGHHVEPLEEGLHWSRPGSR